MLIFWPITDEEAVEDKDDDWEFCCGTIHSWLGTLLFMFADFAGLPLLLIAYCMLMNYTEASFSDLHYALPIVALSVASLTSIAGFIAVVRLYMCLYQHRCSPIHNHIVVVAMGTYLTRLVLFVLFALLYMYFFAIAPLIPEDPDDVCDWENLWGFFHCIWAWTKLTLLAIGWGCLALQFAIGACICNLAMGFVRHRYRSAFVDMIVRHACYFQRFLGRNNPVQ